MSAFLVAGCRWPRAFTSGVVTLLLGLLVVSGCTDGDAVSPGQSDQVMLGLALDPNFSISAAAITQVRVNLTESTGQSHGPTTHTIDSSTDPIIVTVEFDAIPPVTVTVEVELLSESGAVEFSGRYGPLNVQPGRPAEAPIQAYPGPLENLSLTAITIAGRAQLEEGDTAQLRVEAAGRSGIVAHWRSLDEATAQVTANGVVTALRPGSARIVAAAGPATDTLTLGIGARLTRLELMPGTMTLHSIGEVGGLTVRAFNSLNQEVPAPAVTWAIEPAGVAAMTTPGQFRALVNGQATVTARMQGGTLQAAATLVVQQSVAVVTITPGFATIQEIGGTVDFSAGAADANGNPVPNTTFAWSSGNPNVATVDAGGRATAVAPGTTVIRATANGITGAADLNVAEPPPRGRGSIRGMIQSATTGEPLPGATVTLSLDEMQVGSVVTNSSGTYEFAELMAGEYQVTASASEHSQTSRTIQLASDERTVINLVLSPVVGVGQFRIVLTWGSTPADLDSYLSVPGEGECRLIYYGCPGNRANYPYAYLDVDETGGFGPETITISQLMTGNYEYRVHDFTNGTSTSSMALSQSGARVEVYGSNGRIAEFTVPSGIGTRWTVFRIIGGSVVPVNTLDNLSAGAMRPLGRDKPTIQKKPVQVL